jgi:hypothetical protein
VVMSEQFEVDHIVPKWMGEAMRSSICNYCIDIAMIKKRPAKPGQEVRMTNVALLRSRMKGNLHVRF